MAASDYMPMTGPETGEMHEWTGRSRWNALYTVQLGELIEHGLFDWSDPAIDWSKQAYSPEQHDRVCAYFIERFRFREISIVPMYEWMTRLHSKLAYELMPKYKALYKMADDGIDPTVTGGEYHKRRAIGSDYPETLLSGNADYASNGQDEEGERIETGDQVEQYLKYAQGFKAVDELLLDDLECMFLGLYTVSLDGS